MEHTECAEVASTPLLAVVLDRRVQRVDEFADDRNGERWAWQMPLLVPITNLLEHQKRADQNNRRSHPVRVRECTESREVGGEVEGMGGGGEGGGRVLTHGGGHGPLYTVTRC